MPMLKLKRVLIGALLALLPEVVLAQATVSSSGGGGALDFTNFTGPIIVKSTGAGTPIYFEVPALTTLTGARNTVIGPGAGALLTSAVDSVIIGEGAGDVATAQGQNVFIGAGGVGGSGVDGPAANVAIGFGAMDAILTAVADNNTCIGSGACGGLTSGAANTYIGQNAGVAGTSGSNNTLLGASTVIPSGATNSSIAIGTSATITASNQFVAGANNVGVLDVYFGEGISNTTAASYTIRGTGGSGADNAGGAVTIAPGIGTGTAVGGQVVLQRAQRVASGSSAQGLVDAYISCPLKVMSTSSATVQAMATITTSTTTGGAVEVFYSTTASNGTLVDADAGSVKVAWNNNAGTVAATMGTAYGLVDSDASGTLATTPTATVATNIVTINFTPTWVTIVPTIVNGYVTILNNSGNSVACQ